MKKKILFIFYATALCLFTSCTSDWIDVHLNDDVMVIFDPNGGKFDAFQEDELFELSGDEYEWCWLPDESDVDKYPDGWYSYSYSDYYLAGFMLNFNQEIYPPRTRFTIKKSYWRAYYNDELIDSGDMPSDHTFVFEAVWKEK